VLGPAGAHTEALRSAGRWAVCRRINRAFILCQSFLEESVTVRTEEIQLKRLPDILKSYLLKSCP